MDYDPYASDEDSNSRKDSCEGKSPGSKDRHIKRDGEVTNSKLQSPEAPLESPPETTEEGTVLLLSGLSAPLSSGFITALWGPPTSAQWHTQMQTAAAGTNSLFYRWVPFVAPVHATTPRCDQKNITSGSTPIKRAFYGSASDSATRSICWTSGPTRGQGWGRS